MESQVQFLQSQTNRSSPSANTITIVKSSRDLAWEGALVEYGYANSFIADNVIIPQHYFAMLLSEAFTWECKYGRVFKKHTTYSGQICSIYPAYTPFSHRVTTYNEFLLLALDPVKVVESLYDLPLSIHHEFTCQHNLDDPQLRGLLSTLGAEMKAGNPNGKIFVDSLLTALSIHFVTQYSVEQKHIPEYRSGLSRHQLVRAIDYIEAHLEKDLSLAAIAKEVGMSKYYFCRLFKKAMQLTPYQYYLQRRLIRARQFLENGQFTPTEVAYMTGFSDQSHFTRLFKRHYSITPGGIREKKRKEPI